MSGPNLSLVSFIVPVFNEESNIRALYSAVCAAVAPLTDQYEFEFVFTDNHSTDSTTEVLRDLARQDDRVRAYRFSRNFGYQRSILTGYLLSHGAVAIQLDCDLQDPPELIPQFLKEWENGNDVVYGVRQQRQEGWWLNSLRQLFYRLIDTLSEDPLPPDAGDFRLISRRIIEELRKIDDAQPYLRGTIAALGFRQVGITYSRRRRERGESKFSFSDLLKLATDGILNHSIVPLRISTYVGLFISVLTFLGVFGYVLAKVLFGAGWPAGFTTLAVLVLAGISVNAMLLGIIGEYLGRMYKQMKRGPMTIIEEEICTCVSRSRVPLHKGA